MPYMITFGRIRKLFAVKTFFDSLVRLAVCLIFLLCATSGQSQNILIPDLAGLVPRTTLSGGVIYRCLFDPRFDAIDGDGWPDHWQRKSGIENDVRFPEYLDIRIAEHRNPFSNHVLRMDMDGGAAAVFTPKVAVRSGMSYTVSIYVFANELDFSNISLVVSFYGRNSTKPLQSVPSGTIRNTGGWRKLEVGPIIADDPEVDSVSVGLLVLPETRQDFSGRIDFTNLEIRESPTISLTTDSGQHLFKDYRNIGVSCRLAGIDPNQRTVAFVVEDPFGRAIASREVEMTINNRPASQFVSPTGLPDKPVQAVADWSKLPIISPGFYRVCVRTPKHFSDNLDLPEGVFFRDPLLDTPPLNFVVVAPTGFLPNGDFGWNLDGWTLEEIGRSSELLTEAGLTRLKIPAWLPADVTKSQRKELSDLCNELSIRQAKIIGLLTPIPDKVRGEIRRGRVNAASVFSLGPERWMSGVLPTIEDLSLVVRDWQWTADDDRSLSELSDFSQRFEPWRRAFDRFEYGFGIGVAWSWYESLPERFGATTRTVNLESTMPADQTGTASEDLIALPRSENEFVALGAGESLTAEDIEHYFRAISEANMTDKPVSRIRHFVSLELLPESDYALRARMVDLVRRMIAVKTGGAEALFLSRPRDRNIGVLNSDGTPNEMFLPWRTTACMVSGRDFIGSVHMPGGSRNFNFALPVDRVPPGDRHSIATENIVAVLWNDRATRDNPVTETLFFGRDAKIIDLWGRRRDVDRQGPLQSVAVERVPVFVVGMDETVTRLRGAFRLETRQIPSDANQSNQIVFSITNTTDSLLTAQIFVRPPKPDVWTVSRPEPIVLEPGQKAQGRFELILGRSADTGLQPVRFDLRTTGNRLLDFDVYDTLQIGDPDLFMEFSSRLLNNGTIEVYQAFINNAEKEYSYECRLYDGVNPVQKSQIIRRGRGRFEHVYTLPNGRSLLRRGIRTITVRADPIGEGQPMFYSVPLLPEWND